MELSRQELEEKIKNHNEYKKKYYDCDNDYKNPTSEYKCMNKRQLMLTEMKLNRKFGEENIQRIENYDLAVMVLGMARQGKTTLCEILNQKEVEVIKTGIKYTFRAGKYGLNPDTSLPIAYLVENLECKILLYDLPGFMDKTIVTDLSNYYYIKRLFQIYSQVKFLFVIKSSDLDSNANDTLFKSITDILYFLNYENVEECITLIINEVEIEDKGELLKLIKIAIQIYRSKKDNEKVIKFLTYFLEKPDKIVTIKKANIQDLGKYVNFSVSIKKIYDSVKNCRKMEKYIPQYIAKEEHLELLKEIYNGTFDELKESCNKFINDIESKVKTLIYLPNYKNLLEIKDINNMKESLTALTYLLEKSFKLDMFDLDYKNKFLNNINFYLFCDEMVTNCNNNNIKKNNFDIFLKGLIESYIMAIEREIQNALAGRYKDLLNIFKNEIVNKILSSLRKNLDENSSLDILNEKLKKHQNLLQVYKKLYINSITPYCIFPKYSNICSDMNTENLKSFLIEEDKYIKSRSEFINFCETYLPNYKIQNMYFKSEMNLEGNNLKTKIDNVFEDDKKKIADLMVEKSGLYNNFFSDLFNYVKQKSLEEFSKIMKIIPKSVRDETFLNTNNKFVSIFSTYSLIENRSLDTVKLYSNPNENMISKINSSIILMQNVFVEYSFNQEKSILIKCYKTFIEKLMKEFNIITILKDFDLNEEINSTINEDLKNKNNELTEDNNKLKNEIGQLKNSHAKEIELINNELDSINKNLANEIALKKKRKCFKKQRYF